LTETGLTESGMAIEQKQAVPGSSVRMIVAIDGPAGAGKSTIARHLAERFGLLNLESGAMYRAFALKALRAGTPVDDGAALETLAEQTTIHLEPGEIESGQSGNRVFLDGEDVTVLLRDAAVTEAASKVSVYPPIRARMVRLQQELGERGGVVGECNGVVMEGRDIGTVVFPKAEVKIFLDAAPEVRGLRRYEQMGQMGPAPEVQAEEVVRELRLRDERDRNRADSPLKAAEDAVILDSTNLTLDEVVNEAERIVREKLAKI
jgi:cytidylate kinase